MTALKSLFHQLCAVVMSTALLTPAFAQVPVSEDAADFAAFDPSTILRAPEAQPVELLAFDMNRIVSQQMRLIRYQATEYQRKVAEGRARAFVAAQRRSAAAAEARPVKKKAPPKTATTSKSKPKSEPAPKTVKKSPPSKPIAKSKSKSPEKDKTARSITEPKPHRKTYVQNDPAPDPEPEPEREVAPKPAAKKLPRYLAVDTVKDKRASPKAKKVIMIWDTQAESFVGNNLYDVENPPTVGSTAKFETYAAEYIGSGQ